MNLDLMEGPVLKSCKENEEEKLKVDLDPILVPVLWAWVNIS